MSEKANQFIEGLGRFINDSKAVRGKVDEFQLSNEGRGRFLIIQKKEDGISGKDVYGSGLTAISKQLLASALRTNTGAVHLQAFLKPQLKAWVPVIWKFLPPSAGWGWKRRLTTALPVRHDLKLYWQEILTGKVSRELWQSPYQGFYGSAQ